MSIFRRQKKYIRLDPIATDELARRRDRIPDDIVDQCPGCKQLIFTQSIKEDRTCPNCGHHFHFPARERVEWLVDSDTFQEWDGSLQARNPLDFPGYDEKIEKGQKATGMESAILTGQATIDGQALALGVMDSRYMMASMGTLLGEKVTQLFERALEEGLPVVIYIASGGARMQEGILSLMQMAKVSQAVRKHSQAGLFYCAVLTHPTTGGVTASFAMQGDITLAEPAALVGFAGRRVIQQTIKADLPENFQAAETVKENGFIDEIVPRSEQKESLALLLKIHQQTGTGD